MGDKQVVETIFGKHHKFEIVKDVGPLGGIKFYIRKDGKPHRSSFSSLRAAVEAVRDEG